MTQTQHFYENAPLDEAPIFELPALLYGSLLTNPPRNSYSLAEVARQFLWQNYAPLGYVLPKTGTLLQNTPAGINPLVQIEDRIQLKARSWLIAFSAFSANAAGFRFQIWDEGTKDFVLSDQWQNSTDAGETGESPPHWLPEPYLVVSPGRLQIKVVNLANAVNDFQLILHFAVPRGGE